MNQIGFIGYGLRAATMMQAFTAVEAELAVAAIADPRYKELQARLGCKGPFARTRYFATAQEMLDGTELDGVFLGTRCALHAKYTVEALQRGLPLFLEKPVCINDEQYATLTPWAGRGQVLVSFPLRLTGVVQAMKRIIESGALGRITMVQAVNNVPYGSVYYHSWYRNPAETGGLFLQKATHDMDYVMYLLGQRPATAAAMAAKLYFTGSHPAGLHCPACPEYRTCEESSYVVQKLRHEEPTGDACCFAVDTGNEDGATAILQTEGGVLISYSQSFVVKKSAGRRGARFVGTEGSAEFDFYTGEIRHDAYRSQHTARHTITPPPGAHWGGDAELALAFMRMLTGGPSAAPLAQGLESAACCLAMRRSAEEGVFVPVAYGF